MMYVNGLSNFSQHEIKKYKFCPFQIFFLQSLESGDWRLMSHTLLWSSLYLHKSGLLHRTWKIHLQKRSVKLATSSQLLVAGYLFREKLATSSQLLVTRKN